MTSDKDKRLVELERMAAKLDQYARAASTDQLTGGYRQARDRIFAVIYREMQEPKLGLRPGSRVTVARRPRRRA